MLCTKPISINYHTVTLKAMREQTYWQRREEARNNLMNWCPLMRLKLSSRHISTRHGNCSILYPAPTTAIICWLKERRSKSSDWGLPTIAWSSTTYTQSLALDRLATWDSRQQTTYSRHARHTQLPETSGHHPQLSLEKKLYGSMGDLQATAAFIRETGLDIWTGTNNEEVVSTTILGSHLFHSWKLATTFLESHFNAITERYDLQS